MAAQKIVDPEHHAQVVTLIATAFTCSWLISGRDFSSAPDFVEKADELFDRAVKRVIKKHEAKE